MVEVLILSPPVLRATLRVAKEHCHHGQGDDNALPVFAREIAFGQAISFPWYPINRIHDSATPRGKIPDRKNASLSVPP
jgi:hypothetical protein